MELSVVYNRGITEPRCTASQKEINSWDCAVTSTRYGMPNRLENPKDTSQAVGVSDPLVHAVSHSESVHFALFVEQQ